MRGGIADFVVRLMYRYNRYTEENTAKSVILTTGVIMAAGDYFVQWAERRLQIQSK